MSNPFSRYARSFLALFLILGFCATICHAQEYVNEQFGIRFTIPEGYAWYADEQKKTDTDGRVTTLLGVCVKILAQDPDAPEGNAIILLAVYDYPQGSQQEGLDLQDYVKLSLVPEQQLMGDVEKVSVGRFDGVRYILEETDPARYGTARSMVTLIRSSKQRIIEFTASTIPSEYFDLESDNFKMALYGLSVKGIPQGPGQNDP